MNDADYFLSVAQQGLWVVALVSAPLLIPALVIGLVIGLVQAATSINEATLSFVPKLIVVAVCLALFGSAMMALMVDFTHETFQRIPEIAR